jgi:hypothetical protein
MGYLDSNSLGVAFRDPVRRGSDWNRTETVIAVITQSQPEPAQGDKATEIPKRLERQKKSH